jgi:hypothetical protein
MCGKVKNDESVQRRRDIHDDHNLRTTANTIAIITFFSTVTQREMLSTENSLGQIRVRQHTFNQSRIFHARERYANVRLIHI